MKNQYEELKEGDFVRIKTPFAKPLLAIFGTQILERFSFVECGAKCECAEDITIAGESDIQPLCKNCPALEAKAAAPGDEATDDNQTNEKE